MTSALRIRLVLAASLVSSPVLAQPPQALLGEVVRQGQTVEVIDDQGRETTGKISIVSQTALHILRDGKTTEIPFDHVTQIARPKDSLANGALIGLGAGAAFGVLASTVGTTNCDTYIGPCYGGAGFVIGSTLVFGGIGAGIGVGLDALIRHHRIIYRRDGGVRARVTPVVAPGVKGAALSVSW